MAARISSSGVVGLSWQQIKRTDDEMLDNDGQENEGARKAESRFSSRFGKKAILGSKILSTLNGVNNTGTAIQKCMLERATSVKLAINSFKQKVKVATKQKKRLVTSSPSPMKSDLLSNMSSRATPQRRSSRLMQRSEVKMYSPFEIDSPTTAKAPLRPKMGIVERRHARYLWSSPESIKAGVYNMTNDMQALANLSDDWSTPASNQKAKRSNVRTTPRCGRNLRSKKPLFI